MKKYRVYISQEVYENLCVEVEAKDEDEARTLAEQKREDAEIGNWDGYIKDVNFDIEEIENEE